MSEQSITVSIAGRSYPLSVERDQEESIRRVAKNIDKQIEKLRKSYAVRDNQDLLAMVLLEYGTQLDSNKKIEGEQVSMELLTELDGFLDSLIES